MKIMGTIFTILALIVGMAAISAYRSGGTIWDVIEVVVSLLLGLVGIIFLLGMIGRRPGKSMEYESENTAARRAERETYIKAADFELIDRLVRHMNERFPGNFFQRACATMPRNPEQIWREFPAPVWAKDEFAINEADGYLIHDIAGRLSTKNCREAMLKCCPTVNGQLLWQAWCLADMFRRGYKRDQTCANPTNDGVPRYISINLNPAAGEGKEG